MCLITYSVGIGLLMFKAILAITKVCFVHLDEVHPHLEKISSKLLHSPAKSSTVSQLEQEIVALQYLVSENAFCSQRR